MRRKTLAQIEMEKKFMAEKVKLVFFCNGKKFTSIVTHRDYYDRLLGTGKFDCVPIHFYNSEFVEVYWQNENDKRKWDLTYKLCHRPEI